NDSPTLCLPLILKQIISFPFSPLQSLIFLGCVAAAGLGLNLLCLAIYLSCLCCCHKDEDEETKKPNSCCVTWSAVAAGLITW
ncbi:Protein tweety 2-like, partial [Xenoophorus captivus]